MIVGVSHHQAHHTQNKTVALSKQRVRLYYHKAPIIMLFGRKSDSVLMVKSFLAVVGAFRMYLRRVGLFESIAGNGT